MGLKHNTESDTESYVKKNIVVNESDNKICPDKYIDLHLHLDGAITMDIAKKLAALQKIKLPAENDEQLKKLLTVPDTCTSLNDFLKCFTLPDALMMTQEGISEAVYLVAENIRQQGVIYAEIRFAPQNHTENGMSQEEAVQAALEGLKRTELKANIILCCMRGEGNEEANYETLELTKKYLVEDGGVTGMDLAGAEALYPTSKYAALFAKAREYGIPFTIHAGEAAGAESVRCAVENMKEYPFIKYLNEGINVTLNTDDMAIEGITLEEEYRYMENEFGLTSEQKKIILNNAVDAAFTSAAVKEELKKELGLAK